MAVNWSMWEAIGTISAAIVALFLGLYPIIKERNKRPKITLAHNQSDIIEKNQVLHYYLRLSNTGPETAKSVKVRLIKASQGDQQFIQQYERYEIFSENAVQNRDFHSITFIHKNINEPQFVTPAGQDKVYPLAKTVFTALVTGDNFPSIEKTITIETTSDLKLKIIM